MSTVSGPVAKKDMNTKLHKASKRQSVNTENFTSTFETTKNPGKHAPWEKDQVKKVELPKKEDSTPWQKESKQENLHKTLKQQDNNAPWSKDQVIKPKEYKKQEDSPWEKGFTAVTPKRTKTEGTPWEKDQVKQISEEKRTQKENTPWEKQSTTTPRTIKKQDYSAPWAKDQVKTTQERFNKGTCPWDKSSEQKKKDVKSTQSQIFSVNTEPVQTKQTPRKRISSATSSLPWEKDQMDYFKGSKQVTTKQVTDPFNTVQTKARETPKHSIVSPFANEHTKNQTSVQTTARSSNTYSSTASNFW